MEKDLFMGNCQLMFGDCLERMKEIGDKSVDAIICDPPFGTTACKWDNVIPFEPLWQQYKRIIKDNGAIVLFGSEPFTSMLICSNIKMFKYRWVWNKKFASNFSICKYQPLKIHEDICVFSIKTHKYIPQITQRDSPIVMGKNRSKHGSANLTYAKKEYDKKVYTTKQPQSILEYSVRDGKRGFHPTQKPVAILEYLIKTYTNEGETVLDNTMGSGSTGVACVNTNRKFIGIEMDEKYFNIACDRIEEAIREKEQYLFK